jgi:hypothetical protein
MTFRVFREKNTYSLPPSLLLGSQQHYRILAIPLRRQDVAVANPNVAAVVVTVNDSTEQ